MPRDRQINTTRIVRHVYTPRKSPYTCARRTVQLFTVFFFFFFFFYRNTETYFDFDQTIEHMREKKKVVKISRAISYPCPTSMQIYVQYTTYMQLNCRQYLDLCTNIIRENNFLQFIAARMNLHAFISLEWIDDQPLNYLSRIFRYAPV